MNLLEVRTLFVQLSGRHDLVVDVSTYADAGANVYINAGSKLLDQKVSGINEEDTVFEALVAGDFYKTFETLRAIKEVWIYTSTDRYQLEEIPRDKLRELFPEILDANSRGIPRYYAPYRGRNISGTNPASFLSAVRLGADDIDGILFPPVDQSCTLEILGKFYSDVLEDNTDVNYWTTNHGMLLVWAALYLLEVSYRNTEGAKDWMGSIMDALADIEKDSVEEDSENLDQLGAYENV